MKYSFFLIWLVCFWSCKTSKDASSSFRSEMQSESKSERLSSVKDSLSEVFLSSRTADTWKSLYFREYYPWLDENGQPALKSEGWVNEGSAEKEESSSVSNRETVSTEAEVEEETVSGNQELESVETTKTDSRMVQGSEFMWVFIGVGVIAILYNKLRN